MNALLNLISRLFDLLVSLLGGSAVGVMLVVSVLSAAWALKLFQAATPQVRLAGVRDRLLGHIYEMGMYQDHLSVVARIQGDLARTNLRYLSLTLPALVVLAIPMVLTVGQLESRFSHRPLSPGESAVFSVRLQNEADLPGVVLVPTTGVVVTAGPVRDYALATATWSLRVENPGVHLLTVSSGDRTLGTREILAAGRLPQLGENSKAGWVHRVLNPGAPTMAGAAGLAEMTLRLPARETRYLGVELGWLTAFMIFSLLAGLFLKGPLKVSI